MFKHKLKTKDDLKWLIGNKEEIYITKEDATDEGNRIDLIIHHPRWIIGIENKIDHSLYNPIDDYCTYCKKIAGKRDVAMVLLSKDRLHEQFQLSSRGLFDSCKISSAYQVLYSSLVDKVVDSKYFAEFNNEILNPKWVNLFKDFIESIKRISTMSRRYLFSNVEEYFSLIDELHIAKHQYLYSLLQDVKEKINGPKKEVFTKLIEKFNKEENKGAYLRIEPFGENSQELKKYEKLLTGKKTAYQAGDVFCSNLWFVRPGGKKGYLLIDKDGNNINCIHFFVFLIPNKNKILLLIELHSFLFSILKNPNAYDEFVKIFRPKFQTSKEYINGENNYVFLKDITETVTSNGKFIPEKFKHEFDKVIDFIEKYS